MQLQTSTDTNDLSNFIDSTEAHSWNRPRSDEELRSFIESRHALLDDIAL